MVDAYFLKGPKNHLPLIFLNGPFTLLHIFSSDEVAKSHDAEVIHLL